MNSCTVVSPTWGPLAESPEQVLEARSKLP